MHVLRLPPFLVPVLQNIRLIELHAELLEIHVAGQIMHEYLLNTQNEEVQMPVIFTIQCNF